MGEWRVWRMAVIEALARKPAERVRPCDRPQPES